MNLVQVMRKFGFLLLGLFILSGCVTDNFGRDESYSSLEDEIERYTDSNHGYLMVKYNLLSLGKEAEIKDKYEHISYLYALENSNSFTDKEYNTIRNKVGKDLEKKLRNKEELLKTANNNLDSKISKLSKIINSSLVPTKEIVAGNENLKRQMLEIKNYKPSKGTPRNFSDLDEKFAQLERLDQFLEAVPLSKPIENVRVTSNYGSRKHPLSKRIKNHAGMDMVSDYDKKIHSTSHGVVVKAEFSGGYGNLVEIDHGLGFTTRYAHLDEILVKEGDTVDTGEVVGIQGCTGRVSAEHLHYEIRYKGRAINPAKYMNISMAKL